MQLSKDFPFGRAAECAEYLAALGVSHLYCSPVLQAASGSAHGYDVVDPTRISDELGGEPGFRKLALAMHEHGIGLVVDIVPNHMATSGRANPWWWDILKNGRGSRYSGYFDIDWDPAMSAVKNKVLLGVLDDRYGRVLEAGKIGLSTRGDEPVVTYGDQSFPLAPETLEGLDLSRVAADLDAFDDLLQRQHYRLSFWRTAQEELNYRRFFTVDTLAALRMENESAFDDSHRLILQLIGDGTVAGLRVDHVDGLRDPVGYLRALRRAASRAYIVVEKILAYDERLRDSFPVQGTTGYDFIARVDGLFVDTNNEQSLTALYHAFTGEPLPYPELVRACKQEIMTSELSPDLERIATLLSEVCERYRHHRDRTRRELVEALRELVGAFAVYRTYARSGEVEGADRVSIAAAVEEAGRRRPEIDGDLLKFMAELILLEHPGGAEAAFSARFQQLTPAVMAKGVEDTVFYRFNRLTALNEVGGDPGVFGHAPEAFHEHCSWIAGRWPQTMLTLSTHDTKRSADVRARLALLSELPGEWEAAVRHWSEHNDRYRSQGYPDRGLEYLMYQTLVGAWPIEEDRLTQFLLKSAREAKTHTSWINPVAAYEDAMAQFVHAVLADAEFRGDLDTFMGRNQIVALGRIASLARVALLLTSPGVPDLYQGSELWDLSLVDPDNRRPVDFALRQRLLEEIQPAGAADVLARADEGAPKLWLIARLLGLRARRAELFSTSEYAPLAATGTKSRHAVGFARERLVVVVPRLPVGLGGAWGDTTIELPAGRWEDALTGAAHDGGAPVPVGALLAAFPVAVLTS